MRYNTLTMSNVEIKINNIPISFGPYICNFPYSTDYMRIHIQTQKFTLINLNCIISQLYVYLNHPIFLSTIYYGYIFLITKRKFST